MKKTALTIIGWVISAVLIVSLAMKLDFHALLAGLSHASWHWLVIAAVINIAVVALKALRWLFLMRPERNASYGAIFKATMIGMAGNNVMPARGGDWLKIYLIGKWESASKAALTSITGLDKLFDGLAIVILFAFLSFHSRFPAWVQKGTTIISITILVSLVISILLLVHHRRSPSEERDNLSAISRLAANLGSGMGALASRNLVIVTLINSVAICLLQIATIWCCQLAFGEHLDVWIPSLVYVAVNLAIIVPSAPSGVGPFEVAAVLAYTWLGLGKETAFNIALMYHAVQFFPVTLAGLIFYLRRPAVGCPADSAKCDANAA